MKHNWNKKIQVCIAIGCMAVLMTACGSNGTPTDAVGPTSTPEVTASATPSVPTASPTIIPSETPDTPATPTPSELPSVTPVPSPGENKTVPVYGIDEETQEPKSVEAVVPKDEEITPEVVVDLVVKTFADQSITIGIDAVTKENDIVIVSFKKDTAPAVNVGSGTEATILDAIANSLRENLSDCKNVIFRLEGEAYESGHVMFDLNETYY